MIPTPPPLDAGKLLAWLRENIAYYDDRDSTSAYASGCIATWCAVLNNIEHGRFDLDDAAARKVVEAAGVWADMVGERPGHMDQRAIDLWHAVRAYRSANHPTPTESGERKSS